MYAPEFDYHRAGSVAEAIQLLGSHEDAKLLAGGQSLIPLMKLRLARPAVLVDIGRLADLKGISEEDILFQDSDRLEDSNQSILDIADLTSRVDGYNFGLNALVRLSFN